MSSQEVINTIPQEEIISNTETIDAGKDVGKKLSELSQKDPSIPNNFAKTGTDIVKDIESTQKIDNLVNEINNNPELKDPENKNIVQKFINSLKTWNISDAFSSLFSYIQWVMWDSEMATNDTVWFQDNKEIQEYMDRLITNKDNYTIQQLKDQKNILQNKIDNISWTKRKISATYALSRLLDEISEKEYPERWKKRRDWASSISDKINNSTIGKMSQHVKPGDVLAVNKSEQKMWDKLLTQFTEWDFDTSHVLIVTAVDPESGKITVAHSTGSKLNSEWSWVETNLDLAQYTNQFNGIAIATLRPPQWISETLVKNVLSKDGKWYDSWAAASTALLWNNITKNNDKYNCVELIAQSFPDNVSNKRKSWTHPSQMLQELQPTYVTIAGKSMWWS